MKKRVLLSMVLVLSLILALCACGASGASGDSAVNWESGSAEAPRESSAYEPPYGGGPSADGDYGFVPEEAPSVSTGGSYYDNTKIIRTADLSLQSTEFDASVEALNSLVEAQGGYYESSDFSFGSYSGSEERRASFTVRVPQEKFDAFLSAIGDVAHVVSRNTGVQDVGEAYYDAELHLQTLNTKHERLLALLEKAELMEDIISLESALSDVEYQIQQYSSTLKRYDGLINFSTISISLREVVRLSDTPTQTDPFSARLGAAFAEGWNNFCDSLSAFALWAAYNFIGILIFLVIVTAVVLLLRFIRRRRMRSVLAAVPAPPDSSAAKDKTNSGQNGTGRN